MLTTTRGANVALLAAAVTAGALLAAPSSAAAHHGKTYNHATVTKQGTLKAFKHQARKLERAGKADVKRIRRHGRTVGFEKQLASGKKVKVKAAGHGKVKVTTFTRKTLAQRAKQKVAHAYTAAKRKAAHTAQRIRTALIGSKTASKKAHRHVRRH
ncbi:MAG: hypothetical protein AAFQ42_05470 [Pseudomonadota bacterium]